MDPLYTEERESREKLWKYLIELDSTQREREPIPEETREPLSIVRVERVEKSEGNDFKLSFRDGSCVFCGDNIDQHSWSSFDHKENGVVIAPRWQPSSCTLYKLFDRMAQDFFPVRKIFLESKRSIFIFHEIDEISTVMSTTYISLQEKSPKNAMIEAMKVQQQLKTLKNWLKVCEEGLEDDPDEFERHSPCRRDRSLVIPAKRVLDLTNVATGKICIVETANLRGLYAALSHCWGNPGRHPLKTTHATLEDHMSGIKISSLPRSFVDAIKVCVFLRIKYIWIDCLCIVQDDGAEWLGEAEKMAEIYSQSYLTIAATRAQNSQHGFLFDFQDDTVHYKIMVEAPWDSNTSELRTLHATFQIDHKASKEASVPLDKRAWCLQEWYLPKRLVEFCINDIRFICIGSVETRFGRTTDGRTKTRTIVRSYRFEAEDFFRKLWEEIRGDLFQRRITRASDKLPAMAGLAKMLENTLMGVDHRYLAGLWSSRLSEDLSWTVLEFEAKTESMRGIPTWSWASTSSQSDYIYGRPYETFVELIEAHCTDYARPRETQAFLKVKGFVGSLCLRVDDQHKDAQGRPNMSFWINEDRAMSASTERILAEEKASKRSSYFVLDMPISPISHSYQSLEDTQGSILCRASSIARTSEKDEVCNRCMEKGYVSSVDLLLLTKTDVSLTALVLAPVVPQLQNGEPTEILGQDKVYQRLGLLEIDCIRTNPWIETADGFKVPAEDFWDIYPSSRRTVTIV